ncbi:MAG: DUF4340 domain-containing protein [Chloroflexota bacterium]
MRVKSILILLVVLLVVGGFYYYTRPRPTVPQQEPKIYVWDIDMDSIQHITIELPNEGESESFIKIPEGDTFPWYFDDPQHSSINATRWGGGITLLLSGPGADRVIAYNASEETLAGYGLTQPQMKITLTLNADNSTMEILVGDRTPNGVNYYVKVPGTNDVCTVDFTWYEVLSGLVTNPPYASSPAAAKTQ